MAGKGRFPAVRAGDKRFGRDDFRRYGGESHGRLAPWSLFLPWRKLNDRRFSQ